jgi:hypothetical protein
MDKMEERIEAVRLIPEMTTPIRLERRQKFFRFP